MKAILKRDFFSYFHTFTGWIFIAVFTALLSFMIGANNLMSLSSNLAGTLQVAEIICLVLVPILCMRSFAAEQRQKTDQLLFTSPVSVGQVVLGKFLAMTAVFAIPTAIVCIWPLIFRKFGSTNYLKSYIAILGMLLFGMACIAICEFASSLTENTVIAAVLSYAFLFIGYLIPSMENLMGSSNFISKILECLNFFGRYEDFIGGTFSITALVYLLSVIALFLFLTTQVIQKRRWTVSKKTLSFSAFSGIGIAAVLAIAVVVNLAVSALPNSLQSVDLTSSKIYSLTDETKQYLATLDDDITIYVLAPKDDADSTLVKTLDRYQALSDHITVKYVDPAEDPTFIQKYTDDASNIYENSLVVESSQRSTIVNYSDIYEYSTDYTTYSQTVSGYDGEGQIDSAIAYVTSESMPTVYTLTGHNETSLSTTFTDSLKKLNVNVEDLDLMQNDSVPDDAAAVIVNAPATDLSSDDVAKLEAYAENGGDLVLVTNYEATGDMSGYQSLLNWYGVTLGQGVVLEGNSSNYYRYSAYLLPNVGSDTVTSGVTNGYVFAPFSQPLTEDDANGDGASDGTLGEGTTVTYTDLLTTSDQAYVHSSVESESDLAAASGDVMSTYIVGLKAVKTMEASGDASGEASGNASGDASGNASSSISSTAVIFSSEYIFHDTSNEMVSGSNLTLLTEAVSQSLEKTDHSSAVSVPVKELDDTSLTISSSTTGMILTMTAIVLPIILIGIGIAMWLSRRKK